MRVWHAYEKAATTTTRQTHYLVGVTTLVVAASHARSIKRRWLAPILGILILVTALLPLVLYQRLVTTTTAIKTKIPQGHVWKKLLSKKEAANAAPWTLFYHMYFPPDDDDGYQRPAAIVQEQLGLVGQSFATAHQDNIPNLYYTVIGEPIQRQASRLHCMSLSHLEQGQEDVTLQALYNFCHAFPTPSVIYLHTEGSFHANGPKFATQDIWRQRLTQAATHALFDKPSRTVVAKLVHSSCNPCPVYTILATCGQPRVVTLCACYHQIPLPSAWTRWSMPFKRIRESRQRLDTTFFCANAAHDGTDSFCRRALAR